jgi:hypothetical protein
MSSVLISFAPEDESFAQRLHTDLRGADLQVVADNPDVAVDEIVKTTSAVVVVMSPATAAAERVQRILDFARDHELQCIPVLHMFTPMPAAFTLLTPLDMSTDRRYAANLPGLVAVLREESTLDDVCLPEWMTIDDRRHRVAADLGHYLGVLTLIAAPRADQSGQGKPHEHRNAELAWQHHAAIVPALAADGAQSLLFARVMPPTAEQLAADVQQPYRVVCLSAYSTDEALVLENEWEHEAPLYPQHLVNMFADSRAELLILHGQLDENEADILLEETHLRALLLVDPELDSATLAHALSHLYARLHAGRPISSALYAAIENSGVNGDAFRLKFKPGVDDARVTLPPEGKAANWCLIDDGLPATRNVPVHPGFVGRRDSLDELAREIASSDYRQIAIYGEHEAGKSWLAAEYIAQHGWRYPDGVVWLRISEQSKSEDVIGQLLAMLELPPTTNWNTLRELLRERSVLIILDQLDEWSNPLEVGELADFIARLDHIGGTRVLLTSWGPVQPITYTTGTEENEVHPLTGDEARHLTARYVAQYEVTDILAQDEAIHAFAAATKHEPWLIREAIQLVERHGLAAAIASIKELTTDVADPFELHMLNQIEALEMVELDVLRRLQGLRDGVRLDMIQTIAPAAKAPVIRRLLKLDMLRRDGVLYRVPSIIQLYLRQYFPLTVAQQDDIDRIVTQYMLKGTP